MGPVDPSFLVVKKSCFNKTSYLTASLRTPQNSCQYSKSCLKQSLKKRQYKDLNKNGILMKVKRIAECSPLSILQYFWPALSDNWSFFSGRLRQILLHNQQSIYIYAYRCLCPCVGRVYYPNVNCGKFDMLGPIIFRKMTRHFLLHGSLRPTNLEKILSPVVIVHRVSCKVDMKLCKRPIVFMIPWIFKNRIYFKNIER